MCLFSDNFRWSFSASLAEIGANCMEINGVLPEQERGDFNNWKMKNKMMIRRIFNRIVFELLCLPLVLILLEYIGPLFGKC